MADLWEAAFRRDDDNSISEVRKLALSLRDPQDPIEQLSRDQAVQVFRMRAEHTLLRICMFRTKWTSQPSCRLYGFEVESTVHVLFSCPALSGPHTAQAYYSSDLSQAIMHNHSFKSSSSSSHTLRNLFSQLTGRNYGAHEETAVNSMHLVLLSRD